MITETCCLKFHHSTTAHCTVDKPIVHIAASIHCTHIPLHCRDPTVQPSLGNSTLPHTQFPWHSAGLCKTVQDSARQGSTVQCSAVQCSAVQCSAVMPCAFCGSPVHPSTIRTEMNNAAYHTFYKSIICLICISLWLVLKLDISEFSW